MATHSNIFAWKIPWTEEPGGSQKMSAATEHTIVRNRSQQGLSLQPDIRDFGLN